ncbi:MAG TPA: NADPH-dependent assimilatory sulfite reductase hemoprotein subunit [Candidatus Hydrogenedentes bacterium]|nr:NADPH-dependent assimilatory sulfite reductase hemoprotein subunit [Candidatus Hydrogenedentota bacterium]HOS01755.1 NADPH-dependent assimilatory sulfite reductase hemoprotein subunit [Candidatus Hydrogenedentota bacterium]
MATDETQEDAPETGTAGKLTEVELLKEASRGLYGALAEELASPSDHFSETTAQLLKFHGSYQQDNRDVRPARKKQGLDRDYKMMVRTRFPGGGISAQQYLLCDALAATYGQNDMRITSRQTFQFHGVVKGKLRPLIHDLNHLGRISTIASCGDVVRNVTAPPVADIDPRYARIGMDLIALARDISDRFSPKTAAYFDLWLDDEKVTVNADGTVVYEKDLPAEPVDEPLYGKTYLPRKFKIGIATDFDNSIDVYTNDLGVLAIMNPDGTVAGFNILVGGGLGHSHNRPATYPRLATPLAFVQPEEVVPLIEAVIQVQRDHGDRTNRKHARMKYLIDDWGLERFRSEAFAYAGRECPAPRDVTPSAQPDYLGWHKQSQPGLNYVGVWVENGRVRDFEDGIRFKSGLRAIIERHRPDVRLTPHHNLVLANIRDEDVDSVQALLDEYALPTDKGVSTLRRLEMACPALPLCPLATSEAERVFPSVIKALEEAGHGDADVIIRMSGCPNSCSRPATAEIGIVGKGTDQYILQVGGDHCGARLAATLLPVVKTADLAPAASRLLHGWKAERFEGESFGDWAGRMGADNLRARVIEFEKAKRQT